MGVSALAQAMEGVTQNKQGNDYAIFGGGLGLGLGGGLGVGLGLGFGGLVGGVIGSIFPKAPDFDSMTDEEYFASLKVN